MCVTWHAPGPSWVRCPSITGNLTLCELIKVESICSSSIQLTPELQRTGPAPAAKLPSAPRRTTRDNTRVIFKIRRFLVALISIPVIIFRVKSSVFWMGLISFYSHRQLKDRIQRIFSQCLMQNVTLVVFLTGLGLYKITSTSPFLL